MNKIGLYQTKALKNFNRFFHKFPPLNFWYPTTKQIEYPPSPFIPSSIFTFFPQPKFEVKSTNHQIRDDVLFERKGKVCLIQLNRPKSLNAFNLRMANKISHQIKAWKRDSSFIIMKGSGGKAFCTGGDVVAAFEAAKIKDPSAHDFFRGIYSIAYMIKNLEIPFIAFIDGITMGGGVGLSCLGTHRIATEKTVFAMPEVVIGWFTDVGASYFLPRLPHCLGIYYGLTGHRLTGIDVVKGGIATHYCQRNQMRKLEENLLNTSSPKLITEILDDFTYQSLKVTKTNFSLAPFLPKIEKSFSKNSVEEIIDSLQMDDSPWARRQIRTILKMSPTSLKVIHRMIQKGATLSLKECLNMEMGICYKFLEERGDFYEGVRAALIDKDYKPKWYPQTLDRITEEKLNYYFQPLDPIFKLKF